MNGICLNGAEDGHGIEISLDIDTAIAEAVRLAWQRGDPRSTITIRGEGGLVEAVVTTDEGLTATVLRSDGTATRYPRWSGVTPRR